MQNLAEFRVWDLAFYQLGSNVSKLSTRREWFDLEEFFCHGISHSLHDARTFSTFSNLVKFIAPILAPFKIKKILASGIVFDRSLLGYYLDIVSESITSNENEQPFRLVLDKVKASDSIKKSIIEYDELEKNERRVLNGDQKISLNEISRRTHHDYASVHRADHSLKIVS